MAKEPEERYATARELADDLERFLEDKPIRARRPTLLQHARKWARRHRRGLGLAAALAVVLMVTAVGVLWNSNRRITEEESRTRAEFHRAEAALGESLATSRRLGKNLRLSLQALDKFYLEVIEEWLPIDPEMDQVDRRFLKPALKFYEEFVQENSSDPLVRLEAGKAYRRIGFIHQALSRDAKAVRAYTRSIELLKQLAKEFPSEAEYCTQLAFSRRQLGLIYRTRERLREAEESYRQALALQENLPPNTPGPPTTRATWGARTTTWPSCCWTGATWRKPDSCSPRRSAASRRPGTSGWGTRFTACSWGITMLPWATSRSSRASTLRPQPTTARPWTSGCSLQRSFPRPCGTGRGWPGASRVWAARSWSWDKARRLKLPAAAPSH
jgi:tetratricopeptide (TPR) repeat protein